MLDINWSTIVWEIINFLIITVVLYYLVFKPMAQRAEKRAVEKATMLAELKADRDEADKKLEEIDQRLLHLDREVEQLMDDAYEKSKVLQTELLRATHDEAEKIMLEAVNEARKEQFVELKSQQENIVSVVLAVTGETLKKVVPLQVHNTLLDELNTKIWNLGKEDMRLVQNIRTSLAERLPSISISVAQALSNEQRVKLFNTFSALVDKEVELDIMVDPSLIAGVKARVGDIMLDNSLLALTQQMREEVYKSLESETYD